MSGDREWWQHEDTGVARRLRSCVEAWPECAEGDYNPSCCRFPKSCSATVYRPENVTDADLEPRRPAPDPLPAQAAPQDAGGLSHQAREDFRAAVDRDASGPETVNRMWPNALQEVERILAADRAARDRAHEDEVAAAVAEALGYVRLVRGVEDADPDFGGERLIPASEIRAALARADRSEP